MSHGTSSWRSNWPTRPTPSRRARFRARRPRTSTTKPDLTPVSEADRAVEQALRDRASSPRPDHSIVGEEFGDHHGDDAEYRWIIDPIDGTKNYVRGVPIWATLIGLEHAGELVVGVVSAPALGTRWWAARGCGAFRNGEPIRVSSVARARRRARRFAFDNPARYADDPHRRRPVRRSRDVLAHARRRRLLAAHARRRRRVRHRRRPDRVALGRRRARPDRRGSRRSVEHVDGRADADGGSFVCTNGVLHDTVTSMLRDATRPTGRQVASPPCPSRPKSRSGSTSGRRR